MYVLVMATLTPIVRDSEHVVHAGVNLPGVDFSRALGELLYKPFLNLRGLRHLIVIHNFGLWQIQLVGSFMSATSRNRLISSGRLKNLEKRVLAR